MESIDRQVKFQRIWNIVVLFKTDVKVKKAVNLDEDILPHEKNEEQKNNSLVKKFQLHTFQAFAIWKCWILFFYIIGRQKNCQKIAAKCMEPIKRQMKFQQA